MELLHFATAISFWQIVIAGDLIFSKLGLIKSRQICSDIEITDQEGIITSPNYPKGYSNHLSCSWHIIGNVGDVIKIYFDEVDIEESCSSLSSPCCLYNWLKIGLLANNTERKVCGRNYYNYPVISNTHKLWIKFHISKYVEGGRGFKLHYEITPKSLGFCKIDEFKCGNNQCIPSVLRCNGFPDCEDGWDELHCSPSFLHPDCKINEIKCGTNQCISASMRCNGIPDCADGSDEYHCSNRCSSGRSCASIFHCYDASKHCDGIADCLDFSDEIDCGFCGRSLVRCGINSTQCYNPLTERCDKIFHCLNGEDEKDCYEICPGKIMCNSRRSCYLAKHRCNGVAQCEDASDEKNCVPELCNYERGGFLCDNGRCIQEVWTCDRTDDCGDGSDERNCLRNSVLTAAIMGSLILALLLVIAISCTCKLHALRMLEQRLSSRETPLSRLSREFFFREPPPSYAVAVQGSQHSNLYVENLHYGVPVHRSRHRRRRSRRSHSTGNAPQETCDSRNHTVVNPDELVQRHQLLDPNMAGQSSNSVVSTDFSSVSRPEIKNECILTISGDNTNISKDYNNKVNVHMENVCSTDRSVSDSESLNVDPTNVSVDDNSDSTPIDNYYCDSDSEPLVA